MSNYLQAELRQRLLDADDHCCAYCRTTQANSGQPMVVDHIIPQSQGWDEHFAWDASGIHLIGLTPVGRITILVLHINNEVILNARRRWVSAGWHPPGL